MKMGKIKDLLKRVFGSIPAVVDGVSQEDESEDSIIKCPICGSRKWYEGPSGGASVNIQCGECGSKYNYMGPFGLQELEINKDYKKSVDRNKKIDQLLK